MTPFSNLVIVTGGQTGADRAALDFAIDHGIAHAGWCPRGRIAEDGPLGAQYLLQETPSRRYAQRTEWNARDSDATLLLTIGPRVAGGTALALACANQLGRPTLHLHRDCAGSVEESVETAAGMLLQFVVRHRAARLNVAGPRASQEPEIGAFVRQVMQRAFELAGGR